MKSNLHNVFSNDYATPIPEKAIEFTVMTETNELFISAGGNSPNMTNGAKHAIDMDN